MRPASYTADVLDLAEKDRGSKFLHRCNYCCISRLFQVIGASLALTMLDSPRLISYIENDDLKQFTSLLGPPQDQDKDILNSLLGHAVCNNALAIITHLTSLGASPLSDPTFKALFTSTSFPSLQRLVTDGALDINTNLDWSGTFLILAVKRSNQEHVNFCLKQGANPNLGRYGHIWSAMAAGAKFGASIEIINMLLDAGALTEDSDALHTAAENGRIDGVAR